MTFLQIDAGRGDMPLLSVEVDFTNAPTNPTRVWTDVARYVRAIDYVRGGRNSELQRSEAGQLRSVFDNRLGHFEPSNPSSPFYPGVKRTRWIRVQAQWAGVTYNRWQGLIESIDQRWPEAGKDAIVEITASDAFKVLNLFDLTGLSYAAHKSHTRVGAVCTSVGLPYSAPSGTADIVASGAFAQGAFALPHLLDVEETENGLLFAEGDGSITFQDRHYRLMNSAASVLTIGEAGGEAPYRDDAQRTTSDDDLYNQVGVTPSGGTVQTVNRGTSQTDHFTRRLSKNVLTSDTADAKALAEYLANRYQESSPRVPGVSLLGRKATDLWPSIMGLKNSNRVRFRRNAAYALDEYFFVERVGDTIIPGTDWQVKLQMSPVVDETGWVLGDATYGLLGQTTKLTF